MIEGLLGDDWNYEFVEQCSMGRTDALFENVTAKVRKYHRGVKGLNLTLKDRGEAKLPHLPLGEYLVEYGLEELTGEPETLRETIRFLRRCLTVDPAERATAKELLEDDWLKMPSEVSRKRSKHVGKLAKPRASRGS